MEKMKAVEVSEAGGDFELVEREIPEPGPDEVRIAVEACGICHSDAFVKQGAFPGMEYPRIPGHEIIGTVEALGDNVDQWDDGQRVGVGWHGGHCFDCEACREGDFIQCENALITGIAYDGGYAEYTVVPEEAVARVPETLGSAEAAPLLCAGITVYNALRNTDARAGDLVAVQGIGGLGHLGLQCADQMGFQTVALSRGTDKKDLAEQLGADEYIDTEGGDPVEELQELGGARVLLATAPNSQAITDVIGGLGRDGNLLVVAASGEPIEVSPMQLIQQRRSITGWPSGDASDSEDTLEFCAQSDIEPMIETYDLDEVDEAYDRMMNSEVRFRSVLTMD